VSDDGVRDFVLPALLSRMKHILMYEKSIVDQGNELFYIRKFEKELTLIFSSVHLVFAALKFVNIL
jgi:hypothetical protein